jgi:predicted SprT family Zn-dependent metalloprotease
MLLEDAQALALAIMDRYWYKFEGWSFAFDNAKRRCGATHFRTKTITLSRHFVRLNDEDEVRETILHEVAHVIAGQEGDRGHGDVWKYYARHLGAKPERCATDVAMPEGNIEGVCAPGCAIRHTRHRMPTKRMMNAWRCKSCYETITWVRVK